MNDIFVFYKNKKYITYKNIIYSDSDEYYYSEMEKFIKRRIGIRTMAYKDGMDLSTVKYCMKRDKDNLQINIYKVKIIRNNWSKPQYILQKYGIVFSSLMRSIRTLEKRGDDNLLNKINNIIHDIQLCDTLANKIKKSMSYVNNDNFEIKLFAFNIVCILTITNHIEIKKNMPLFFQSIKKNIMSSNNNKIYDEEIYNSKIYCSFL